MKELNTLEKNKLFSEKTNQQICNPKIPKVILKEVFSSKKILEDTFQLIKIKKYPVKRKFLSREITIPGYYTFDSLWKTKK